MAKKSSQRLLAYAWLSLNTVLWGVIPVIAKASYTQTTPYRFLLYRFLLAVIFSLPILIYYLPKIKKLPKTIFLIAAMESIGTALTLALLYLGLKHTTAIESSLITAISPLFVTIGGWIFLHEVIEKHEKLGLALALCGSVILALAPILVIKNGHGNTFSLLGGALIFLQDLIYVGYLLLIKKRYQKIPKFFVSTISFYVGLIAFLILSWWELGFSTPTLLATINSELFHNQQLLITSIYMAFGGSILGLTSYLKGNNLIEASEASLFWYLQPLVTIPVGMFWLHEKLTTAQIVAMVFILAGVYLAEKRTRRVL